jgi:hypothetical protein
MKIQVSNECYSELSIVLKRLGRELNDGASLIVEKGDALVPPQDFRMVAIRQNCLSAAAEVLKLETNTDTDLFLNVAQAIFNWCLNGEVVDKTFLNGENTKS